WQFSVRDYGLGVEPEFADGIFDLFKRLRPDYPGSGVGLAICRRIVERHGGRIWVESREGGGATFTFTLSKDPTNAGSTRPFAAVSSPRSRGP
ncbi:MAG TPA: HAMP domain-containing histidine kinase, partial [Acidobacteria bacterium]|nr:HAMP domain-containing histidine kinase [Acidobacteriota bacterium]